MPSPFPGMDPYLEWPDIWRDFHDRLAGQISGELNHVLPRPYYARLEMRLEVGIVGGDDRGRIVPDVTVVRPRGATAGREGVAVLDPPRAAASPTIWMRVSNEPLKHHFVEIRDAARGHALVTLAVFGAAGVVAAP